MRTSKAATWTVSFHEGPDLVVPGVNEIEIDDETGGCLILGCGNSDESAGAVIPLAGLHHAVGVTEDADDETAAN